MRRMIVWLAGIGMLAVTLSGCYEAPDVTVHEPGTYKGPRDPLLATDSAARADTLAKRFEMVQTDR